MTNKRINELSLATVVQDKDYFVIDKYISPGDYETNKVLASNIFDIGLTPRSPEYLTIPSLSGGVQLYNSYSGSMNLINSFASTSDSSIIAHINSVNAKNPQLKLNFMSYGVNGTDTGSTVYDAVVVGNLLYIGGNFTFVAGQSRTCLAAIDLTTGRLTDFWSGIAFTGSYITSMCADSTYLYVAGNFSVINGVTRARIARITLGTNTVDTWYPTGGCSHPINTMVVTNGLLYVGGQFTTIASTTRNRFAVLTTSAATLTNCYATSGFNSYVLGMFVDGEYAYCQGYFTQYAGQTISSYVCRLTTSAGTLDTSWLVSGSTVQYVNSIDHDANNVYVGGDFITTFAGVTGCNYIAKVSKSTGIVTPVTTGNVINGKVKAVKVIGDDLYVGGAFTAAGSVTRNGIASINHVTDTLNNWYPPSGIIGNTLTLCPYMFKTYGSNLLSYGQFTNFGQKRLSNIAITPTGDSLATSALGLYYDANLDGVIKCSCSNTSTVSFDNPSNPSQTNTITNVVGLDKIYSSTFVTSGNASITSGDTLVFKIERLASNGADTTTLPMQLISIEVTQP